MMAKRIKDVLPPPPKQTPKAYFGVILKRAFKNYEQEVLSQPTLGGAANLAASPDPNAQRILDGIDGHLGDEADFLEMAKLKEAYILAIQEEVYKLKLNRGQWETALSDQSIRGRHSTWYVKSTMREFDKQIIFANRVIRNITRPELGLSWLTHQGPQLEPLSWARVLGADGKSNRAPHLWSPLKWVVAGVAAVTIGLVGREIYLDANREEPSKDPSPTEMPDDIENDVTLSRSIASDAVEAVVSMSNDLENQGHPAMTRTDMVVEIYRIIKSNDTVAENGWDDSELSATFTNAMRELDERIGPDPEGTIYVCSPYDEIVEVRRAPNAPILGLGKGDQCPEPNPLGLSGNEPGVAPRTRNVLGR